MSLRQSQVGPARLGRGALATSVNLGAIPAKDTLAANIATAVDPAYDPGGSTELSIVAPRLALPAGLLAGKELSLVAAQLRYTLGNMTVAPIDPAAADWDSYVLRLGRSGQPSTLMRASSSGRRGCTYSTQVVNHPNIVTLTTVEAATAAIPAPLGGQQAAVGDLVIASPRAALPAGLVYSHSRVSAPGVVQIALANPTGGGIDPAAITWDLAIFSQALPLNRANYGRPVRVSSTVIDPPLIAAASVVEVAVNMPGAQIGDPVFAAGVGAEAGIMMSHGRVSATDTVQVGVANITAGGIDPAAFLASVVVIPRVPVV